ncbi:MAG: metallophosphoesterase [Chlamydiota bacterium]
MKPIKIAHISDLHFSRFSPNPAQFFSKRWLGNLNLLLNRAKEHLNERPFSLIPIFKEKGITDVIISGDLTTTSTEQEYKIAERFVASLKDLGMAVFTVPGNHDHYTKKAGRRKVFYESFPSPRRKPFSLATHGVTTLPLTEGWHLALMDTTYPSSLVSSNGYFSPTVEENLKNLLGKIDPEENIILVNHFPFFQHDRPRRRLIRGEKLRRVIASHPNIQIYLHGHTHRRTVADLRPNQLPIILDSGSTGHLKGSWNELRLEASSLELTVHQWVDGWKAIDRQSFSFEPEPWYRKGLRFKCTGCGKCCTKKGHVWLEQEDIAVLAEHLRMTEGAFIKRYTRNYIHDLALLDHPHSDDCIFLEDKKFCKVYAARPKQCRTFPWWKQNLMSVNEWEKVKGECEGIDHPEAPTVPRSKIEEQLEN